MTNVLCNFIRCKHNKFTKLNPPLCGLRYLNIQGTDDKAICSSFEIKNKLHVQSGEVK